MGSKSIMLIGAVAIAIFLFLSSTLLTQSKPYHSQVAQEPIETIIEPAVIQEDVEVEVPMEKIAIPAFGFMTTSDKNQIVALMSDNDQNGKLTNYLDKICKEQKCMKDIRFEKDILDASWQETAAQMIDMFVGGSIENGSLFIENNTFKIEGMIKDYEAKLALDKILESAKDENLTIENFSKLSENAQKAADTETNVAKLDIVTPPKVKKKDPNKQKAPILETKSTLDEKNIPNEDLAKSPEVNSTKLETPVPPKVEKQESKKQKTPTFKTKPTLDEVNKIKSDIQIKPIAKMTPKVKKESKKTASKPTVKTPKKAVVKQQRTAEIIPNPVMETTLETSSRLTTSYSIDDNSPVIGLVAKPYMSTSKDVEPEVINNIPSQEKIDNLLLVAPINFEVTSSQLTAESKKTLKKIIDIVNSASSRDIVISGHTDSEGDKVYNKALSQKRADAVKRYLKQNGIKSKRIRSIGYGEEQPLVSDHKDPVNRRVEIEFLQGDR